MVGKYILIVVTPVVLAQVLCVATLAPVRDRWVGGLGDQRLKPLVGGGVLGIVESKHRQRGLYALDVRFRLRDTSLVHLTDDRGYDHCSQQPDDDHDDHDLDQSKAPRSLPTKGTRGRGPRSVNLLIVLILIHTLGPDEVAADDNKWLRFNL